MDPEEPRAPLSRARPLSQHACCGCQPSVHSEAALLRARSLQKQLEEHVSACTSSLDTLNVAPAWSSKHEALIADDNVAHTETMHQFFCC